MIENHILPLIKTCYFENGKSRQIIPDDSFAAFWVHNYKEGTESIDWNRFKKDISSFICPVVKLPHEPTPEQLENATEAQLDDFSSRTLKNEEIVQYERIRRYSQLTDDDTCTMVNKKEELFFFDLKLFKRCLYTFLNCKKFDDLVNINEFGKFISYFGSPEGIIERVLIFLFFLIFL